MKNEPKKIMCAIDFSDFTGMILSYGKFLAKNFEARLYLCHVIPETPMISSHMAPYLIYAGTESERIQSAKERLEDLAKKEGLDCDIAITTGHPADEINREAEENSIDMVIAATHGGSGIKRFLIGSVTSRLVKILTCPLLVLHTTGDEADIPAPEPAALKNILVGCDFSEDSDEAFDRAFGFAKKFKARLHLAHVMRPESTAGLKKSDYIKLQSGENLGWTPSEYLELQQKVAEKEAEDRALISKRLERQLAEMVPEESRDWCTPVTILLEGQPYKELLSYAEKNSIDMIVLGIRGHGLLEQFLVGSTTDRVISRGLCPVLAVRHPA